jgi:serine/threonine protein kinase
MSDGIDDFSGIVDQAVLNTDQILANRYRLILLVGQGTMGAVYDAEDLVFNRRVALKRMRYAPEASPKIIEQTRAQFEREAKILATLRHPNLPRVTDYFTFSDQEFLVMDYIEGLSLEEILALHPGGLDEAAVLGWTDQLLSALEYIHRHGLIHRDVKPANIRVTPEGHVFLVDFGLVKTFDPDSPKTATAVRGLGTPQYAPPEQYDAELGHTEPRSDLYALGATMYHLLTGEPPATVTRRVSNPGSFRTLREIKPAISPEVERIILRAMEVPMAKRFANAGDMRSALQLAHDASVDPTGTSRLSTEELIRVRQKDRRRRWAALAGLVALLAACATAFIAVGPGLISPPTFTPTNTATNAVPVALPSSAVTNTPTTTPTTISATDTATPTLTPSVSATAASSATLTLTPSATLRRITPTQTPTFEPSATFTPTRGVPPKPPTAAPTTPPQPTIAPTTPPKPTPIPPTVPRPTP